MIRDFELQALEKRPVDEVDSTGRRCDASHPDVGICHRRFDHARHGDPWHHSATGVDDKGIAYGAQYWRWKERE